MSKTQPWPKTFQNHNASPAKDGPVSVAYGMKKDWFRWKVAGVYCTLILSLSSLGMEIFQVSLEIKYLE